MSLRQIIRTVAICALVLYGAETFFGPKGGPGAGNRAPQMTLKGHAGQAHALAPAEGMVQVLDFWATWCSPCKKSLPALQRLHETYRDRPDVQILSINVDEGPDSIARVQRFLKARGFSFPVAFDSVKAASAAYDIRTIPTLVIIDGQGRVHLAQVGLYSANSDRIYQHLKDGVEAALASEKP